MKLVYADNTSSPLTESHKNNKPMPNIITKKAIRIISVFLLMTAVFGFLANIALAQTTPAANPAGTGAMPSTNIGTLGEMGLEIAIGFLTITQSFLNSMLVHAGFILDTMIELTFQKNILDSDIIKLGWSTVRDIVNAVFILIMLWIALTIIFNKEDLGGRRLLIKIVAVALLMNFSLVFVAAIFGISNLFAKEFVDLLPTDTNGNFATGDFIMDTLRVSNLFALSPTEASSITTYLAAGTAAGTALGCGAGLWLGALLPFSCKAGAVLGASAGAFTYNIIYGDDPAKLIQTASILLAGNLYIFLTILAFILASIGLVIRVTVMTIVAMLAPAAFLAFIFPVQGIRKYWSIWLEYTTRWAFFAPAFFFLFYMSLYMLKINKDLIDAQLQELTAKINPVWQSDYWLTLILSLALFYACFAFARKFGGAVATAMMSYGTRYGKKGVKLATRGIFATGRGAAAVAAPVVAGIASREGGLYEGIRTVVPGAQRGAARMAATERKRISDIESTYSKFNAKELSEMLSREYRPDHRSAIAKRLGETGQLSQVKGAQEPALYSGLKRLQNTGENVRKYLKQKPNLALEHPDLIEPTPAEITAAGGDVKLAAMKNVIQSIRPADIPNIERDSYSDEFVKESLKTWTPYHLAKVFEHDPTLFEDKFKQVLEDPAFVGSLPANKQDSLRNYFSSNAGVAMGISVPSQGSSKIITASGFGGGSKTPGTSI